MEPQEHRERQDRAREGAAARGLEGLVAISRGGHDRVADALWLAGLATSQPFVPDLPRHWRAARHVAVVLRAHGRRRRRTSDEQSELIAALRDSVTAGIDALRPGAPLSDVAGACEDALAGSAHARRHGVPRHLMGGFWGHGLGLGFEPPRIGPESTDIVEPGWCLAVERRAAVPGLGRAQYDDDVLIGPGGAELLQRSC